MVDFVKLADRERRWKELVKEKECGCDMLFAPHCGNSTLDIHMEVIQECDCECHVECK